MKSLVWNQSLNICVAVAENAKGRGEAGISRKLVAAALALSTSILMVPTAQARPTGG